MRTTFVGGRLSQEKKQNKKKKKDQIRIQFFFAL